MVTNSGITTCQNSSEYCDFFENVNFTNYPTKYPTSFPSTSTGIRNTNGSDSSRINNNSNGNEDRIIIIILASLLMFVILALIVSCCINYQLVKKIKKEKQVREEVMVSNGTKKESKESKKSKNKQGDMNDVEIVTDTGNINITRKDINLQLKQKEGNVSTT